MIIKLAQKTKHAIIKHKVISWLILGAFCLLACLELIYLVPELKQKLPESMALLAMIFVTLAMFIGIYHPVAQTIFTDLAIGADVIAVLIKVALFII